MTLHNLIEFLESLDHTIIVKNGFGRPHTDRSNYSDLAFNPASDVTIESMLDNAKYAVGRSHDLYEWATGD